MKRMRMWSIVACLAMLLAVIAVGCGSDSEDGNGDGEESESGLTIGFATPDLAESFWLSMSYGVDKAAEEEGVEIARVSAGGDANADRQISQLQDLIQRGVDAIIVGATDGDAVRSVVDQAAAQNIPVVGLSSIPNTDTIVSAVGADHYGMGEIQAKCLGNALNGEGSAAVLGGPAGQSWADDRLKGFEDTLASDFPQITIAATSRLADNRNAALTTVEDWIQRFPELSGIYSATDDIGSGAIDAINAAGKKIPVSSSNFSPAAERLLDNGSFVCVSVQKIVTQGEEAVRQAVAAAKGETVEAEVVTPVVELTKDNVHEVNLDELRAPEGYSP